MYCNCCLVGTHCRDTITILYIILALILKVVSCITYFIRCKVTKKKVVVKKRKMRRKMVLSPQRRGNVTAVVPLQRKPFMDKKSALKSQIQDILNGRSRFVIRKEPAVTREKDSNGGRTTSSTQEKEKTHSPLGGTSKSNEEVKTSRFSFLLQMFLQTFTYCPHRF